MLVDDVIAATSVAVTGYGPPMLGLTFENSLDPWKDMLGAEPPGAVAVNIKPRHPKTMFSPVDYGGTFDVSGWEGSVTNGAIPQRQMAEVGHTGFYMEPHAAAAMWAMIEAAAKDGVQLTIGGSYRSRSAQASAYAAYQAGTHPAPVARPGTSNHGWGLAVDFVITSENHAWLVNNADRYGFTNPFGKAMGATENWHWEYGQGGPAPNYLTPGKPTPRKGGPGDDGGRSLEVAAGAPAMLADPFNMGLNMRAATVSLYTTLPTTKRPKAAETGGSVKQQLYDGFMHANRPDLAKMVYTKAFDTWVGAESGWQVDAASPANNQGLPNFGLFQFWQGHSWVNDYLSGGHFTASPFEQAGLVARYFDLTPDDIRSYAAAIRGGSYRGWG